MAKKGASLHPQPAEGEKACAAADWEVAKQVTRMVGRVLKHFPTIAATQQGVRLARKKAERAPGRTRAPTPPPPELESRHHFRPQGRSFFCERCFATAFSAEAAARRERTQPCAGEHPGLSRLTEGAQQLEHSLLLAVWQGKPTLICQRCGAMASSDRHTGLRMPCPGQPANGRAQDGVWRTERGLHPHQRKHGPLDALLGVSGVIVFPLQPRRDY